MKTGSGEEADPRAKEWDVSNPISFQSCLVSTAWPILKKSYEALQIDRLYSRPTYTSNSNFENFSLERILTKNNNLLGEIVGVDVSNAGRSWMHSLQKLQHPDDHFNTRGNTFHLKGLGLEGNVSNVHPQALDRFHRILHWEMCVREFATADLDYLLWTVSELHRQWIFHWQHSLHSPTYILHYIL